MPASQDHTNVIVGGEGNAIQYSVYCTIIGGINNVVSNKYNTHFIGNAFNYDDHGVINTLNSKDNALYIGCENGVFIDGDIVAKSNISDERLKDNIKPIENCLEKVLSLDAVEFDWNDKQETYRGHDIGVIAQQVQKIAPEIIQTRKGGYLAVDYKKLNALVLGAIREQDEKLLEIESKLGIID